jgi:hypothetical protein
MDVFKRPCVNKSICRVAQNIAIGRGHNAKRLRMDVPPICFHHQNACEGKPEMLWTTPFYPLTRLKIIIVSQASFFWLTDNAIKTRYVAQSP